MRYKVVSLASRSELNGKVMMEEAKAQADQTPGTQQCAICLKMLLLASDNQVKKPRRRKKARRRNELSRVALF